MNASPKLGASKVRRLAFAIAISLTSTGLANADTPQEVFEQRIVPIFKSEKPSSCVQCHLSSVDLKDYIRPTAVETFRSLREHNLVDVKNPEQSKILTLIMMGETDNDRQAQLIHKRTRDAEYAAFKNWIVASSQDKDYLAATYPTDGVTDSYTARPEDSVAVIRHARKDRVLDSFTRNIWSQRMRCFPCHTPTEIDPNNPKHAKPLERYKEFVQKYGKKMDLFGESPLASMQSMIASSRKRHGENLPLLNLDDPKQSLLIVKPISKLPARVDGRIGPPSSETPVSHMGGLKMRVDDVSYKAFIGWITDYATLSRDGYDGAESLPSDNWIPTQNVIRVKQTPDSWPKLGTVQLFVYPVVDGKSAQEPVAFTQTLVGPRGFAAGPLFLFSDNAESPEEKDAKLEDGAFEIRAFLDSDKVLASNPTALLNGKSPVSTTHIDAQWKAGFPNALVIDGQQFK